MVVLSGPNIASEIARHLPATTVAASNDNSAAEEVQSALMSKYLRVYTGSDVAGAELGGSLKNVIAIAAGIIDGMELGANTKGALFDPGPGRDHPAGNSPGSRSGHFCRPDRNGGPYHHLFQPPQPQPYRGSRIGQGQRLDAH